MSDEWFRDGRAAGPEGAVRVAAGVVLRRGADPEVPVRILIGHRFPDVHLPDYWEFPGGKLEPGEDPAACAVREVREETGVVCAARRLLTTQLHRYPDRTVEISFHLCDYVSGLPQPLQCRAARWVRPEHLICYPFPNANQEVLAALRAGGWLDALPGGRVDPASTRS
jgi:mutator protein MutT